MTHYLSAEEILQLHFLVIEDYGGSHGVRDEGRVRSVIEAPAQEAFGVEQYKTVYENCLLYTSPSPRDRTRYRMPSSA